MFKVNLNGSATQGITLSNCSSSQQAVIDTLAKFVLEKPIMLDVVTDVFRTCINKIEYENKFQDLLDTWSSKILDQEDFATLKLHLVQFYNDSSQIDNDAGYFLERLFAFALKETYQIYPVSDIQYACKITTHCDEDENLCCDIENKNIDVCGLYQDSGDFIECKKGLRKEDQKAHNKILALSKLRMVLEQANKKFTNTNYQLSIFVLCKDNSTKMTFYQNNWPDMDFMGIDRFKLVYC